MLMHSQKSSHPSLSPRLRGNSAVVRNALNFLDSRLHGNDVKRRFPAFYESINTGKSIEKIRKTE